jgi:hypothetical protein
MFLGRVSEDGVEGNKIKRSMTEEETSWIMDNPD